MECRYVDEYVTWHEARKFVMICGLTLALEQMCYQPIIIRLEASNFCAVSGLVRASALCFSDSMYLHSISPF